MEKGSEAMETGDGELSDAPIFDCEFVFSGTFYGMGWRQKGMKAGTPKKASIYIANVFLVVVSNNCACKVVYIVCLSV